MKNSSYDKYVVYVPKKSAPDAPFPFLTLMSNELVPECNTEVTLNWVAKIPEPKSDRPLSHAHDYDELILNIGTDPTNPEDLGAEVIGFLGDQKHVLNKTSAVFIPRNVQHGIAGFNKLHRPYLLINVKLGGR